MYGGYLVVVSFDIAFKQRGVPVVVQQILAEVAVLKEVLFARTQHVAGGLVALAKSVPEPPGRDVDLEGDWIAVLRDLDKAFVPEGPPGGVVRQVRVELGPVVEPALAAGDLLGHGVISKAKLPLDLVDVEFVLLLVDVVGVDVGLPPSAEQPEQTFGTQH